MSDVLARWRHLAGALGVKPGQTSTIEASNRGAVERCMEESDNLLASQDVFIRSYIHLMSTTQLDRSRSPTMPCILLVYIPIYLYIYIYIYIYRKIAARCTTRLARSRSPIIQEDESRFRQRRGRGDTKLYPDVEVETERGVPHSLRRRRKIVTARSETAEARDRDRIKKRLDSESAEEKETRHDHRDVKQMISLIYTNSA